MYFQKSEVNGKTALVTGAGKGIGKASAIALAEAGADLIILSRTKSDLEKVKKEIIKLKRKCGIYDCDVSNFEELRSIFNQISKLDILVNNAGVGSTTVTAQATDVSDQDTLMLKVNAEGTLKMCQHFLALPDAPGKKIINVSSVGGGITVFPDFRLSDGMSKSAIAFLTRQLAAETVHLNIDVFAVCPGATNTRRLPPS